MKEEEKGEFKDFTDRKEKKEYKNKVIWLHKSRKGDHLYAFANEGVFHNAKSILMNVSEVMALIEGFSDGIKISIISQEDDTETKSR